MVDRLKTIKILLLLALIIAMTNSRCLAQNKCSAIMIDLVFGEPVTMEQALDDMASSRIVYLAEHHTIARHHSFQLDIIKGLAQRGISLAIGMEMFSIEHRSALNQWMQEGSGIDELAKRLGPERWNNLKDYTEILKYAVEIKAPLIGLNAPDALVRKVARQGLEGLSDAERKDIPSDLTDINPQYEKLLRLKLRVHKSFQTRKLDSIILAQALRDAVMAKSIVEFLNSESGSGKTMVVIAGGGHLNYGFGIPERVSKHLDVRHRIALPSESGELVLSEHELRHAAPLEITHEDLSFIRNRIADYLSVLPLRDEDAPALTPEVIQAGLM